MQRAFTDIPAATIERLSAYKRWLQDLDQTGRQTVVSHELAGIAQVTAAQVRRDLMQIGFGGSPAHGYDIPGLRMRIGELLDPPAGEGIALIGIGQLGRVLLKYLTTRRPAARFVAAFDVDPAKTGGVLLGVPCYPIDQLESVVCQRGVRIAVLTVPAGAAQELTSQLVACGVRGILNFAPVRLRAPAGIFIENVDIATRLERAAFFARHMASSTENRI